MNLRESENEFMRLLSGSDSTLCCQLFPLTSTVSQPAGRAQCSAITHLFGPKAFVSLGAAIKAPSAWKCGITDKLLRGPVAWPFSERRHHTSSESHTPQSPILQMPPCFPVSVSDSQLATVPGQPATQPDVSSSSLLLLRCSFSPDWQENEWNR